MERNKIIIHKKLIFCNIEYKVHVLHLLHFLLKHVFSETLLKIIPSPSHSPPDRRQPILELRRSVGCDVERRPCRQYDTHEILVLGRRQVIELLVHTLNVHLLALLHQRQQRLPQMLHDQRRIVARHEVGRLNRYVLEHEGAGNRADADDAKVMQILGAQALRDLHQPLDVFAVRWISAVFGLRTIVVDAPGECFHGEHARVVGGD